MRIIVCGIPPAQSRAMERRFPEHDVRVIGAQEREHKYLTHLTDCDLCVVNVRLISHQAQVVIRSVKRDVVFVHGPSSAEAAIRNAIEQRREA